LTTAELYQYCIHKQEGKERGGKELTIKLYYYNAFITYNGEKTSIPFQDLLDHIIRIDEADRFKQISLGEFSLLRMRYPEHNHDFNDRSFFFADYRVRKPKAGERGSDDFNEIDFDVFESTNCFYQHTERLFIIQYNHYGAKAKQIISYFNQFLTEEWGIDFVELTPNTGLEDVLNSDDIRFLDIKLDLNNQVDIQHPQPEEPGSVILNLLNYASRTQEAIGGNVANLYFGNGQRKTNRLEPEAIKDIIRLMDLESDLYMSIRIRYFSNTLGELHELDLKNASILKEEIAVEGDAWETIADSIEDFFYNQGRVGAGQLNRHNNTLTHPDHSPF